jgi:hypothetical protein
MTNNNNLLRADWETIDSADLRMLLESRIGGAGQYTGKPGDYRLYLPLVRTCKVALRFDGNRVSAIERGSNFDEAEWAKVSAEFDALSVARPDKFGRDIAFSSYRVAGSWRGARSGVQILPPPEGAPTMPYEMGQHPFTLEIPLLADREWNITNRRRLREHRKIALLLNILLVGRVSCQSRQTEFSWAILPQSGNLPMEWVQIGQEDWPRIAWVQCSYMAKLDPIVADEPSPPAGDPLEVIAPDVYYALRGLDGKSLRVPADLDESICAYQNLSRGHRERFDRALFWMDLASADPQGSPTLEECESAFLFARCGDLWR